MNIKHNKDIWRFTEQVKDGEDVYDAGYYYVDFAMQLVGPYDTLEEARAMKLADDKILERR